MTTVAGTTARNEHFDGSLTRCCWQRWAHQVVDGTLSVRGSCGTSTRYTARRWTTTPRVKSSGPSCGRLLGTLFSHDIVRHVHSDYVVFYSSSGFTRVVVSLVDPAVNATVALYNTIVRGLLPTPAKPHYTFNLRDVSKVVQVCVCVCLCPCVTQLHQLDVFIWSFVVDRAC